MTFFFSADYCHYLFLITTGSLDALSHVFSKIWFEIFSFFPIYLCHSLLGGGLAGLRTYSIRQSVTPHVSFLCHNWIYFVLLAAVKQELNLSRKESKWGSKWHYIMTSYSWSLGPCCYWALWVINVCSLSPTLAVQQHFALLLPISTWIKGISLPPGSMECACEQCSGSFLLHPPAWHCGIPGNETESAFRCVQAAIIAKITFHYHPHYPSHIHSFFKQPFVCEEIDVTRQLRTMGDSIRSNLVLVKNQNEACAHETDQACSGVHLWQLN